MSADQHVVLDSLRQTLRCDHCRAEALLPPQPAPISEFTAGIDAFTALHVACLPQSTPLAAYVRTAPGGAAMRRDERGHWWSWTPAGERVSNQLPTYSVRPVLHGNAIAGLKAIIQRLASSSNWDDKHSVRQAKDALISEGVAL